jgi:hypothetical protein
MLFLFNKRQNFQLFVLVLSVMLSNTNITIDKDSRLVLFLTLLLAHNSIQISIVEHLFYLMNIWMQINFIGILHLILLVFNLFLSYILLHILPGLFIIHDSFNKLFYTLFLFFIGSTFHFHVADGYHLMFFYVFWIWFTALTTLTGALESVNISFFALVSNSV